VTPLASQHELLSPDALAGLPEGTPDEAQVAPARRLIDAMSAPFEPVRYRDEFRERVLELIRRKANGQPANPPPPEEPATLARPLDEALRESVEQHGQRRAPTAQAAKRSRPRGD
jgi:DNA end-binding protein Ku